MACSKIFSGDLPELLEEIIKYFQYDYKTLYSSILVNRLWCRLTIPLLWENPFLNVKEQNFYNYYFISIYLYNHFNDEEKSMLNESGFTNSIFPSNTLFNYSCFIKSLNKLEIVFCIEHWIAIHNAYIYLNPQIFQLIYKSLFEVFINNEANLHTFEYYISDECKYVDDVVFELISQNPSFILNIRKLKLEFNNYHSSITENFVEFSKFLCFNCNSISTFYFNDYNGNDKLIEKYTCQIINSQQNLKTIILEEVCMMISEFSNSVGDFI
jgi:hypothetical protein